MPVLVPISIVLAGFFQGIINTLLTTIAMEIPGLQRNVASSSYSFVRFFGGALAPFIAGVIGEHIGKAMRFILQVPLFLSVYVVSFITVIILLQMKKNKKSEVVKSCPASSHKNSQTKIASHIFRLVGLITADASF